MAETPQTKHVATMFTDMVGYSALSQRNEALALTLLQEHQRLVRLVFARHCGHEKNKTGDGLLVEFPTALDAAQCAVEIQGTLREQNAKAVPAEPAEMRIGIHWGDVDYRETDVLGDTVNIASRIVPLAKPGGICISVDVARQIKKNRFELSLKNLGPQELKGIELPVDVYRIVLPWEPETLADIKITEDDLRADPLVQLRLRHSRDRDAAEAAIRYFIHGDECSVASWRKSSTWEQVKMVYEKLSKPKK